MCAIFIESTDNRQIELEANDIYLKYIFDDILPFVEKEIKITSNPNDNVFAGLSRGGFFAAFAALSNSHLFGNYICQSPGFWINDESIVRKYNKPLNINAKFYIDYGYYEKKHQFVMDAIDNFINCLQNNNIPYKIHEFPGAHIYTDWRDTLPNALKYLLNA